MSPALLHPVFSRTRLGATLVFLLALLLCSYARAQAIGEIYASDASIRGSVLLASSGAQVLSGSSVGAGTGAAVLRLTRGGEVRICPKTSITVNASQSGRELMLGLSSGSVELHYALAASADTIITPDFRILLAGPGTFQFAVAADAHGDTSVRSFIGSSASVIVSELMGDGTYQVRPGDEVVFHHGRVADSDHLVPPDCGCPEPKNLIADAPKPKELAPPPPAPPSQTATAAPVHVEVDAPFVFRATEKNNYPDPVYTLAHLSVARVPPQLPLNVTPPAAPATAQSAGNSLGPKPHKRGFFGRMKAIFASVFH